MRNSGVRIEIFFLVVIATMVPVTAQSTSVLRIVTPVSGVVVHPGTTVTVTVQCSNTSAVTQVSVLGDAGLGTTLQNVAASMTFNLNLPSGLKPGGYRIRALGGKAAGQGVTAISDDVVLQVPL